MRYIYILVFLFLNITSAEISADEKNILLENDILEIDEKDLIIKDKSKNLEIKSQTSPLIQQNIAKNMKGARIKILNKITNQIINLNLKINQPLLFKNLTIIAENCMIDTDNHKLLIRIYSYNKGQETPILLFYGWLFNNEISANIFAHAVFDLNLIKCLTNEN